MPSVLTPSRPASRPLTSASATLEVEQLFSEHSQRVYSYCLRELGSPEEAEDVLQDTYLNAWRSYSQGVRPDLPLPWLLQIARNVCISRYRSASARVATRPLDETEAVSARPESRRELFALSEALAELPETQRRAFVMREWRGLALEEIAAELELSYSAVATHLFRGRRSLAAALQARLGGTRDRLGSCAIGLVGALKSLLASGVGAHVTTGVAIVATTGAIVAPTLHHRPRSAGHGTLALAPQAAGHAGTAAALTMADPGEESPAQAEPEAPSAPPNDPAAAPPKHGAPPPAPTSPSAAAPAVTTVTGTAAAVPSPAAVTTPKVVPPGDPAPPDPDSGSPPAPAASPGAPPGPAQATGQSAPGTNGLPQGGHGVANGHDGAPGRGPGPAAGTADPPGHGKGNGLALGKENANGSSTGSANAGTLANGQGTAAGLTPGHVGSPPAAGGADAPQGSPGDALGAPSPAGPPREPGRANESNAGGDGHGKGG